MKLTEIENIIACKVGIAYDRQYSLIIMDTSVPDIAKLVEETVATFGVSFGQALAYSNLQAEEDRAQQICEKALASFMAECDKSHLTCSDRAMLGN